MGLCAYSIDRSNRTMSCSNRSPLSSGSSQALPEGAGKLTISAARSATFIRSCVSPDKCMTDPTLGITELPLMLTRAAVMPLARATGMVSLWGCTLARALI